MKLRPFASLAGIWHERTAFPFSRTVHDPQTPTPHPNFVPVIESVSRNTQTSGVSSSTFTTRFAPLTVMAISLMATEGAMRQSPFVKLNQLIRRNWQVPDAFPSRVINGVRNCRRHSGDSDLAHAARADRIEFEIRFADK